jgi:cell division septal protein FtsQ
MLTFGFFALLWTRPVTEIEVRGVWMASTERIASVLSGEVGRRWVTTPVRDFEIALAQDPWIEGVRVSRVAGGRLLVEVHESQPVFVSETDARRQVLDRRGLVLPASPDLVFDGLPRLEGVEFDGAQLAAEDRDRVAALLEALDQAGWIWSEGLARVQLGDDQEVLLESTDGVQVVVALPEASDQLRGASVVWGRLDPGRPARVDLRFKDQVVLSDMP